MRSIKKWGCITLCALALTLSSATALASSENHTEVYYDTVIKTSGLGRYQFEIESHEKPSHEVLPIISKEYFPSSTVDYDTEVDNTAPDATYSATEVVKVDVIFALGKLDQTEQLQNYMGSFESRLQSAVNNIDAKVEQVKTQEIGFGGNFDWELSGGGDGTGPRVTFGDTPNGSWIFFDGYNYAGPRDGAWMPLQGNGKLSIEFDVDASTINNHPGGEFVFRFGSAESGPDDGDYAEVWTSLHGSGYREKSGYYKSINAGTQFRLGVVANSRTGEVSISVNGVEVIARDNVKLTSNSLFPYFQHGSHACDLKSSTKISGIKMEILNQKSLGEAINDVSWRDGAARFIVHATDVTPVEMQEGNDDVLAYTITKLLNSNCYLINLGIPRGLSDSNEDALNTILNSIIQADGTIKGTFINNRPITTAMNNAADYIINEVKHLSKPTSWVLVNTEVLWETTYSDNEKDLPLNYGEHDGTKTINKCDINVSTAFGKPLTHYYTEEKIQAEKWRYRHFNDFYDNSPIREGYHSIWLQDPVDIFQNPGKFRVNYKRRDNPMYTDSSLSNPFDEYRYWSTHYDKRTTLE